MWNNDDPTKRMYLAKSIFALYTYSHAIDACDIFESSFLVEILKLHLVDLPCQPNILRF